MRLEIRGMNRVDGRFVQLWGIYVSGFKPDRHCIYCLKGRKEIRLHKAMSDDDLELATDSPYFISLLWVEFPNMRRTCISRFVLSLEQSQALVQCTALRSQSMTRTRCESTGCRMGGSVLERTSRDAGTSSLVCNSSATTRRKVLSIPEATPYCQHDYWRTGRAPSRMHDLHMVWIEILGFREHQQASAYTAAGDRRGDSDFQSNHRNLEVVDSCVFFRRHAETFESMLPIDDAE